MATMQQYSRVYVRDGTFEWLPATVLKVSENSNNNSNSNDDNNDRVLVRIDLPDQWNEATILGKDTTNVGSSNSDNGSSSGDGDEKLLAQDREERWVSLRDYFNHQLPLQNKSNGRRQQQQHHHHRASATKGRGGGGAASAQVRDMAELEHVHEASMLYTIKDRHFHHDRPYTRVGDIVVAVNPCQWIERYARSRSLLPLPYVSRFFSPRPRSSSHSADCRPSSCSYP
jgi:hypothetical protein